MGFPRDICTSPRGSLSNKKYIIRRHPIFTLTALWVDFVESNARSRSLIDSDQRRGSLQQR